MSKVPATISASLNKNISALCPFSIARNSAQNHCAHYVSHMMGYEFPGPTCKNFTRAYNTPGATVEFYYGKFV